MATSIKVPSKVLLGYFEIASNSLHSIANDQPLATSENTGVLPLLANLPADPSLSWHRVRIVNSQLSSLEKIFSDWHQDNGSLTTQEVLQAVLREIGLGDFSNVEFGRKIDDEREGEIIERELLNEAMKKTNEAARVAFARSVLSLECLLDRRGTQATRNLRDDSLDKSSILEYCGIMMTVVRLSDMHAFLQTGNESIFKCQDPYLQLEGGGIDCGSSAEERLTFIQKLCWRAVGWEPNYALEQMKDLVAPQSNHSLNKKVLMVDESIAETLIKYASTMTVALTHATIGSYGTNSSQSSTDDGTTRITNVSYSEKIISVPQSKKTHNNKNIQSLSAPTSHSIHEHTSSRQRQELEIAQKTSMLQNQLWNEFQALTIDEQTKKLEEAKVAQESFFQLVRNTPPGPERVLLMQNMDGESQKLLVIYKLWCSKNDSAASV